MERDLFGGKITINMSYNKYGLMERHLTLCKGLIEQHRVVFRESDALSDGQAFDQSILLYGNIPFSVLLIYVPV